MRIRPAALIALLLAACQAPQPPPAEPEPAAPEARAGREPLPAQRECVHVERLQVRKSTRTLAVFCKGGGQRVFHVALGREPGAKLHRGDWRTPEGRYRISGEPHSSRFHLFIPIDYPSEEDARRARDAGLLSDADYAALVHAIASGSPASQGTVLGGGLGLHGEGERWRGDSPYLDWTNGCIALSDENIDYLATRIAVGTPLEILP